ncbi:MAG: uroporphyrinogen decarboxylase [Acidobacteriota bacterium]
MNLIQATLSGDPVPRRPLWIMRQAGRVLPEYRALKEKYSFLELSRDPELAAEVTLLPFRHFDFDAAITFADIMSPLPALGVQLDFSPGPVLEKPIRSAADVAALPEPEELDPEQIAPEVAATQRIVAGELPAHRALLGFVGAPLTLAAYLIQGQGARDFPALRAFVYSEPEAFSELLRKLTGLTAKYAKSQFEAGAEAIQVFDSWAGLLEVADWRRHVRPHLLNLLDELGEAGVPRILFLHSAPQLVPSFLELPCEVLGVDWRTDLVELRAQRPDLCLQGNLDPALLLAPPDVVRRHTEAFLQRMPPRGHIVNLGHGLLPQTPLDSIHAFFETVRSEQLDGVRTA